MSAPSTAAGDQLLSWLTSSTIGSGRIQRPVLPPTLNLGFTLPDPPTSADMAIAVIRQLRAAQGLPNSFHYNDQFDGLRQNRLVHAVLMLLLQCLDQWAQADANANVAVTQLPLGAVRNHQLCPILVCFNSRARDTSFRGWFNSLTEGGFTEMEKAAYTTISEATTSHRASSANLYLVATNDDPSNSFLARHQYRVDPQAYAAMLQDPVARQKYTGRHGNLHEVAVLFAANSTAVYIYDPSFNSNYWRDTPLAERRLCNAPGIHRVHQLIQQLTKEEGGRDRQLKKATIHLGGGGGDEKDCLAMSIRWAVDVIARHWIQLDGKQDANAPLPGFGEGDEKVVLRL